MKKIIYAFTMITLAYITISSQNLNRNPLRGGEPIRYTADSMIGYETPTGPARDLQGNVVLTHGNVTITSVIATQYLGENRAVATGNVRITQKDLVLRTSTVNYNGNMNIAEAPGKVIINDNQSTLTADRGTYNTNTEIADFQGNVIIEDDSANIYAERIIYHRRNQTSYAYDNVLLVGKFTNVVLNGDSAAYFPSRHYAYLTGRPLLYQIDTVRTDSVYNREEEIVPEFVFDTLSISADSMEAFRSPGNEYYVFTGNVEVLRDEVSAVAQRAVFFKDEYRIELEGVPVVWFDSTQLHADSISMFIPDNKLERIYARGKAFAGSKDDTLHPEQIDQLSGQSIEILFSQDTIRAIKSYTDSKSVYFMVSVEEGNVLQRTIAEDISMEFNLGELENVRFIKNIDGSYYPQAMLPADIKSMYLPEFRWRDERPEKREMRRRIDESGKSVQIEQGEKRLIELEKELKEAEEKENPEQND